MKAVYLDQVNTNPEGLQKKDQQSIKGADIFGWNLLSALLEYGTYDTYFAQGLTEEKKQLLLEGGLTADSLKRLVAVPLGAPLPINDSDQLVFLTAGRFLNALAVVRMKLRRYAAPVCGFIHSINSPRILLALLQQCFVGLSDADLLFCSSRAGMRTIDVYISEINRLLSPELHYPVRRSLVPLGVNPQVPWPEARRSLRQRVKVEESTPIAMYFGRFSQASKCDLGPLLVALSQLLRRGTDLSLIVAGDDTQTQESSRLKALASELGCTESVKVWPNPSASEKHLLFSGVDFFVSPSDNLQETFGLAVAEAMAYGLSPVISDWDGYRDLVKDGETGFLVPSVLPPKVEELRLCDCVTSMFEEDELAQSTTIDISVLSLRMEKLARDAELREQMGRAARRFVESHCTWRVVVRRYEELWEESLSRAACKDSVLNKTGRLMKVSLKECFGHYANGTRNQREKCFISEEGREWLKRPSRFYFLGKLSTVPCPHEFAKMLNLIAEHPGISSAQILEKVSNNCEPVVMDPGWVLARLFKYGLVTES